MLRKLKLALKILGGLVALIFLVLIVLFYRFSNPKSNAKIEREFADLKSEIYISRKEYKDYKFRMLATQKEIDTLRPNIVFVHGSIGSAMDFKRYLADSELNELANLISYDRVGYGVYQTGAVQESILFESRMLEQILEELDPKKTIVVGYSYGGPIALALKTKVKSIVLLAPAVYSEVEPMPWALNFYKWQFTRWLLPKIWEAASREKLSHRTDLKNFEQHWNSCKSRITSIHGAEDWIVPFENSVLLKEAFPEEQFKLIELEDSGHSLVWSNFEEIKSVLTEQLN
jgi:pimeloyl-ACP methyl ester carboxylesterase